MVELTKKVKQDVLTGIISFMGKLNANKFKTKPEQKESEKEEITPEMLEKLKALYGEKEQSE